VPGEARWWRSKCSGTPGHARYATNPSHFAIDRGGTGRRPNPREAPVKSRGASGGLVEAGAASRNFAERAYPWLMRPQVFINPQPLLLSGGVLVAMAGVPGLPTLPFLLLGLSVGYAGWRIRQKIVIAQKTSPAGEPKPIRESLDTQLKVEPLAVEVGLGLVKLVGGAQNSPLLPRIAGSHRRRSRPSASKRCGYHQGTPRPLGPRDTPLLMRSTC